MMANWSVSVLKKDYWLECLEENKENCSKEIDTILCYASSISNRVEVLSGVIDNLDFLCL
jgi:hypothetical protein